MENSNKDEGMKIPEHCSSGGEIVEGFGKIELLRTGLFAIAGLFIGIIITMWKKDSTVIVLTTVIGAACGYVFCKKDRYTRQSIIDILIDFRKFQKSQKYYEYKR